MFIKGYCKDVCNMCCCLKEIVQFKVVILSCIEFQINFQSAIFSKYFLGINFRSHTVTTRWSLIVLDLAVLSSLLWRSALLFCWYAVCNSVGLWISLISLILFQRYWSSEAQQSDSCLPGELEESHWLPGETCSSAQGLPTAEVHKGPAGRGS